MVYFIVMESLIFWLNVTTRLYLELFKNDDLTLFFTLRSDIFHSTLSAVFSLNGITIMIPNAINLPPLEKKLRIPEKCIQDPPPLQINKHLYQVIILFIILCASFTQYSHP